MAIGIPVDYPGFARSPRFQEWTRQGMVPSDVIAAAMTSNPRFSADPIAMNPLMNFPPDGNPGLPQDEPPILRDPNPSGGIIGRRFVVPLDMSMDQAEPVPIDIGMGIPYNPGEPVTSVNLEPATPESSALRALSSLGGRGGGFRMPAPVPSAPRRQVGSRPEFIYTNPVAAQQAASNYAARLGAETGQERGYQDYASRVNESQAATDRTRSIAEQQADAQSNQVKFAAGEGAANRSSAERIAAMQETVRQQRIADAAWAENERAAEIGDQTAAMLNADPNARVDRKFAFLNPATGKWESRFRRQPRPAQPTPMTPGTPSIATPVPEPAPPPAMQAPVPTAPAPPAPAQAIGPGINRITLVPE